MWYMPYRRVLHAVLVYVSIVAGISLLGIALRFWPGFVHMATHVEKHRIYTDAAMLVSAAAVLAGGFATVLGLNLAAENEGHLELAWTKPVSREGYALGVFAVDIAALAACILFTAACAAAVIDIYAGYQAVAPSAGEALLRTLAFCGLPLTVYAWVTALSASLKRNRGTVAGLFWPLMIALAAAESVPVPAVRVVASTLDLLNPLAIYYTSGSDAAASLWSFAWGWLISALLLTAALVQWRRLEL
jgi:hypothetical protein